MAIPQPQPVQLHQAPILQEITILVLARQARPARAAPPQATAVLTTARLLPALRAAVPPHPAAAVQTTVHPHPATVPPHPLPAAADPATAARAVPPLPAAAVRAIVAVHPAAAQVLTVAAVAAAAVIPVVVDIPVAVTAVAEDRT